MPTALTPRQRDFLLLSIYFQMLYGFTDRAAILSECLIQTGEDGYEARLAYAVTAFAQRRWDEALRVLQILDQGASGQNKQYLKLSSYIRSRCFFEKERRLTMDNN